MKLIDMHVHTASSPDAVLSAHELCKMAKTNNIGILGFVAHLDLHPEDYCYNGFSEEDYLKELDLAENTGVTVLRGLEVGEPHLYLETASSLFKRENYDFLTGALHWLGNKLIINESAFTDKTKIDLVEEYYLTTLKIVESCQIDILAHLGMFRRGIARAGLDTSFDEIRNFPSLLKQILNTMIEKKIVLEVNTSGLRRPEAVTYPGKNVLTLYKELGGTLITLGSDTHLTDKAFYGLSEGFSLLKECGFHNYGYIQNHRYVVSPLH